MRVYIVYDTDGYVCGNPLAAFTSKELAEEYKKKNFCSGLIELTLNTDEHQDDFNPYY